MRDHLAPVEQEQTQQRVFLGGQLHHGPRLRHHPPREIDLHVAETRVAFLLRALHAPQHRPQAREQFATPERLAEIIVCPGVERLDLVRLLAADREDEHGQPAPFAQPLEHLDAGQVGQAEIEDDGVGPLGRCLDQARSAALRLAHAKARAFQCHAQQAADLHLVVDDKHFGLEGVGAHSGGTLAGRSRGRKIAKRAPPPGWLPASTRPPCASAKPRAMESPRPSPPVRPGSPR